MSHKEIGHQFLARLGKKRLRPGGVQATNWLIKKGHFSADSRVLEVACNQCTSSIDIAKAFSCHITALDLDSKVIEKAKEKAKENVKKAQLEEFIEVIQGNALRLPFPDNSLSLSTKQC